MTLLPFDADQSTFDAWEAEQFRRTDLELPVDVYDMIVVFVAARHLASKHPDKLELFNEHVPQAVEEAGKELGMYMGISALCGKLGIDLDEGVEAVNGVFQATGM